MSFTVTLRVAPARLVPRLASAARPAVGRALYHSAPKNALLSRTALYASSGLRSSTKPTSLVSRLHGARRSYQQQTTAAPDGGGLLRKLLVGGAIFGGTLVAVNMVFNRETRDDGGMPPYEREYLNNTFLHTGLGIGIIGLTARQMVKTGFVYRIMMTNPWVMAIGGIGLSFATMIATRSISPDK